MTTAGSLVIDLLLRTGSFSTDAARSAKELEKIKKAAYDTGRQIGDSIKGIAAAVGVGLSVGAFASLIKGSIDAADHLNDLSKRTGIAVDALGGIGFAAKQAGLDLDSVAAGIGKLNKSIAAVRAGDKTARQGFDVLGIDVDAMTRAGATATDFLATLSDKFAEFEDGPEKAALAIRVFGKAGADLIPLLNDGGDALIRNIEYFQKYSGVTEEVAGKADQFNDTLEKINLLSSAFGNTLAAQLLPTLQVLADAILDAKENTDLFNDASSFIGETFKALVVAAANVTFVFKGVGREIGAIAAQLVALSQGDFGRFTAISDEVKADAARARKELDAFEDRVLKGAAKSSDTPAAPGPAKRRAPGLPDIGNANAELKKQLDGRIKLIREFSAQEVEAYQFAQKYVEGVFDDGLLSLKDRFDAEKKLRDAATASQVKALDDEIAATKAAARRTSGADRVDLENRVAEAVQKRADVIQKASQADILAAGEEARQIRVLRDSYDDLRSTVLDLKGDTAGAAALRNKQAVEAARDLITRAGGDPGLADQYGDLLRQTTELSQAQRDYNTLLERSQAQEEALLQVATSGGASEIDTLKALGAQRSKSLEQLGAMAAKARELADQLGTPEAVAFADRLANAFRKASAEVDPLLLKLREVTTELGNGFGEIFGRAIEQGRGLKAIISDIGNLVQRVLTEELISKPLSKSISEMLGGTGSSGGLLGSFLGIGKGGGSDAGVSSTTASFTALQTIGIEPTIAALVEFRTALGASAATSSTSGSSGGFLDSIGSFFGSLFGGSSSSGSSGFAVGGYTGDGGRNDVAGFAHKGEVIFDQGAVKSIGRENLLWMQRNRKLMGGYAGGGYVSDMASRVYGRSNSPIASSSPGAGAINQQPMVLNQTFLLNQPTDRRTQQQVAAEAGRGVQRAQSRNT